MGCSVSRGGLPKLEAGLTFNPIAYFPSIFPTGSGVTEPVEGFEDYQAFMEGMSAEDGDTYGGYAKFSDFQLDGDEAGGVESKTENGDGYEFTCEADKEGSGETCPPPLNQQYSDMDDFDYRRDMGIEYAIEVSDDYEKSKLGKDIGGHVSQNASRARKHSRYRSVLTRTVSDESQKALQDWEEEYVAPWLKEEGDFIDVALRSDEDDLNEARIAYKTFIDRKWNEEYQALYESPVSNMREVKKRYDKLERLVADFTRFCQQVSSIIVSELGVSPEVRSIKPNRGVGGVAGGEKFTIGGAIFKFARDDKGVYGGDDEAAQKAASNELRGMNAVLSCETGFLNCSLTVLCYYRGHCIIGTAFAPIDDTTLLLGSSNAGSSKRVIHDDDPTLRYLVSCVADELHLKEHTVDDIYRTHKLRFAVDVEGHQATDGRYYLVDLARLLPCTLPRLPLARYSADVFYRVFRPEFMRQHIPDLYLSADSFSAFGQKNAAEHHLDIEEAYRRLIEDVVPCVSAEIENAWRGRSIGGDGPILSFSNILHNSGVNMRELGRVLSHLQSRGTKQQALSEMVARAIKCRVRRWMRHAAKTVSSQLVVGKVLRVIFFATRSGVDEVSEHFWTRVLFVDLMMKYGVDITSHLDVRPLMEACREVGKASPNIVPNGIAADFALRLLRALDISYDGRVFKQNEAVHAQAHIAGLIRGERQVHQMVRVKRAQVRPFLPPQQEEERLTKSLAIRGKALGTTNPSLVPALWAMVELYRLWGGETSAYETGVSPFERGEKYIQQLKEIRDLDVPMPNFGQRAGRFYFQFGKFEMAKQLFEEHLREQKRVHSQNHVMTCIALIDLANTLGKFGRHEKKLELLKEALEIQLALYGADHVGTARLRVNIANAFEEMGDDALCVEELETALLMQERHVGPKHPHLVPTLTALAGALGRVGKTQEKKQMLKRALSIADSEQGSNSVDRAITLANMCDVLSGPEQVRTLESVLELIRGSFGEDHVKTVSVLEMVGVAFGVRGDYRRQVEHLEQAASILGLLDENVDDDNLPPTTPVKLAASALCNLGIAYGQVSEPKKQRTLLERSMHLCERPDSFGIYSPKSAVVASNLGVCLIRDGEHEKAASILDKARRTLSSEHKKSGKTEAARQLAVVLSNLGLVFGRLKDKKSMKSSLDESLALFNQHDPHNPARAEVYLRLATFHELCGDKKGQAEMLEKAHLIFSRVASSLPPLSDMHILLDKQLVAIQDELSELGVRV